jgi:hypothetical protein
MTQITPNLNGIDEFFLSKLSLGLLKDIPRIFREHDLNYPQMEIRAFLLMVLYNRVCEKLLLAPLQISISPDKENRFPSEQEIREEFKALFGFEQKRIRYFDYNTIIDQFLEESLQKRGN